MFDFGRVIFLPQSFTSTHDLVGDLIQFNLIHEVELIKYIFKVSLKAQLFGLLRN